VLLKEQGFSKARISQLLRAAKAAEEPQQQQEGSLLQQQHLRHRSSSNCFSIDFN